MDLSFKNKNVLVTGASRGIGKATAGMFAASGAKVIIHYNRDRASAENVYANLDGEGHRIVQADLAYPGSIEDMLEGLQGNIDILVNNAGIYDEQASLDMDFKSFQAYFKKTMDVNLYGPVHLSYLVAKRMREHGGGKIINISSRGAFRGEPNAWPYGASKAALNSFGQSMALALAGDDIFVYTIAPGFVLTDMTEDIMESERGEPIKKQSPLNRIAKPEEIAKIVLMTASEGTEYMTGCIIDVNGASYLRS
jgi:NAD(P)-dependent dehydrogenase (short-subunit alcohol dehydrogenase family)